MSNIFKSKSDFADKYKNKERKEGSPIGKKKAPEVSSLRRGHFISRLVRSNETAGEHVFLF